MLHAFLAVFDRGSRGVFPERLLEARWTACSCGVEHARATCPECAAKVAIPAARAMGRCRATRVFATRGRVLAAAWRGKLEYAYEENGALHREDGARLPFTVGPSARVAVLGGVTWLFDEGRAAKIVHGAVTERHDADAFDADLSGAYVAHGGWLSDAESGARLGQVIGRATWLRAGPRFAIGFYRAGKVTLGFVVRPGRGMKSVPLPPVVGKLVDAAATFDGDHALMTIATEHDGRRTHAAHLVSSDGAVLASASGPPESRPVLGFGACMAHGAILLPTDDGLVLARADLSSAALREDKSFPETRDFVASGADLLAGPHGSVYLVHTGEVVHLSLV
jgi:hypothetical protein